MNHTCEHSHDAALPSFERYLDNPNPQPPFPTNCLFYAGAGDDIDPALRFIQATDLTTVVYVDYDNRFHHPSRQQEIIDRLHEGFRYSSRHRIHCETSHPCEIHAKDLGFESNNDFSPNFEWRADKPKTYHEDPLGSLTILNLEIDRSYRHDFVDPLMTDPVQCDSRKFDYARERNMRFARRHSRQIQFYYLYSEAIQTYLNLWALHMRAPDYVVVQNHGKGGLWTSLDGDGLFYAANSILPRFLYVGDINTVPWPNYQQVSQPVTDTHSMHQSCRALYQCTAPIPCNVSSPLFQWDGTSPNIHSPSYPGFEQFILNPARCSPTQSNR